MKRVNEYNNPAVQFTETGNLYVAGISKKYDRPLTILEGKLNGRTKLNLSGVLVTPASVSPEVARGMKDEIRKTGFQPLEVVPIPQAVTEFYLMQKRITETDRKLLVVYLEEGRKCIAGEITYLEQVSPEKWSGKKVLTRKKRDTSRFMMMKRDDKNYDESKDFPIVYSSVTGHLRIFCQKYSITEGVVMFAGMESVCKKAALRICEEDQFSGLKVNVYKPETAATLGAALYASDRRLSMASFSVPAKKTDYYKRNVWGKYENLSPTMKKAYWTIVEDVAARRLSGEYECDEQTDKKKIGQELNQILHAIHCDFPELGGIVWDLVKSNYSWRVNSKEPLKISYTMLYPSDGERRLMAIEQKADEIIQECMKMGSEALNDQNTVVAGSRRVNRNHTLSDEELIKAVHDYFCKHYAYCKAKLKNGKYPARAYSLEAIFGDGVCGGYSLTYCYILHKLQIKARYIDGWAEPIDEVATQKDTNHAWTMVELSDGLTIKHVDLTWDICRSESAHKVREEYYMKDDIQMQILSHTWRHKLYPACV